MITCVFILQAMFCRPTWSNTTGNKWKHTVIATIFSYCFVCRLFARNLCFSYAISMTTVMRGCLHVQSINSPTQTQKYKKRRRWRRRRRRRRCSMDSLSVNICQLSIHFSCTRVCVDYNSLFNSFLTHGVVKRALLFSKYPLSCRGSESLLPLGLPCVTRYVCCESVRLCQRRKRVAFVWRVFSSYEFTKVQICAT